MEIQSRNARLAALLASAAVGVAAFSAAFMSTVGCTNRCIQVAGEQVLVIGLFAMIPLGHAILAHRTLGALRMGRPVPRRLWMIILTWCFAAFSGIVAGWAFLYLLVSPYLHGPNVAIAFSVFALCWAAAALLSAVAARQLAEVRTRWEPIKTAAP